MMSGERFTKDELHERREKMLESRRAVGKNALLLEDEKGSRV